MRQGTTAHVPSCRIPTAYKHHRRLVLYLTVLGTAFMAPRLRDTVEAQTPTASESRAADQEQQFNTYVDEGRFKAAAAFLARVDSFHIVSPGCTCIPFRNDPLHR